MENILLIRFSIEKLNELPGPYAFQKGFLVGKAVPARLLKGLKVFEGDTLKTLQGEEYVTFVAIEGDYALLKEEIEPRIVLNENIAQRKAEPLVRIVNEIKGPISEVHLAQDGSGTESEWCTKGFLFAWN